MSLPSLYLTGFLAVAVLAGCSKGAEPKAAPAPREVGVLTLKAERVAFTTQLPGRTVAPVIAEIRPQVSGIVQKRLFTEGAQVKAGQVLYQIDPATYEAAQLSAQAAVRRAESTLATARTVAKRNAELVKIDAISQQVNESTQAAAQQAEADVAVAQAAAKTASINLGYTRIVSPISGWVSLSSVTPGALVTANQTTALTTVQQLEPMNVHVTQSSADLLRLKRELVSGKLQRINADEAPIRILLEDGSRYSHEGRLTFSGVTVDAGTGSVTLRAVVPNPERTLMPGMYVRAVLQEAVDENAVLVPQQAVTRAPDGTASVLLVNPANKVEKRVVTVGRAITTRWQVLSGLQVGEKVLVEGSQRARVGDTVKAVEVSAAPKPAGAASGPAAAASAAVPPPAGAAASSPAASADTPAPAVVANAASGTAR